MPEKLRRWIQTPQAGGVVLFAAAAVALVWAGLSPRSYAALRHPVTSFVVDDVLMTIFFFVAGLDIREEVETGSLSDVRRAALPVLAALGGMIAPALIYLALAPPSMRAGWGIPTATDIAFALGVLSLLGTRVPPALRVLLLAVAVVDDLGAIALVAVFYASEVWLPALLVAPLALALRQIGRARGQRVRPGVAAVAVWLAIAASGIHPTIAGAALGLATRARDVTALQRLRTFVSVAVMPLFALLHAGVRVSAFPSGDALAVSVAVALALAVGKPVGVLAVSWISVRLRLAALPPEVGPPALLVLGATAGIGFTMSLLIGSLAFETPALEDAATIGVLAGSALATLACLVLGRAFLSRPA